MSGAKPMSGLFSKKKTMVPHKWRSENFVTFHVTIGQVYDANTKLLRRRFLSAKGYLSGYT